MNTSPERILIVEDDPEVSDLIARQVLKPLGYRVKLVHAAPMAIQEVINFEPDVIIANLNLSGLSGKDLMVALTSQGLTTPVIVIAEQDMDGDIIQAFRLGASDYLGWPIREAEVVSAVERVLTQVRSERERDLLARKIQEANQKLQNRVRELTTITAIGKAVTSIADRDLLFDKIIEGAVFVSDADKGWLLLRQSDQRTFYLSAEKNLPESIADRKDQPWDDGISSLVALSGESLSIHGAPLRRFKVAQLGRSAIVVPVKIKKEVVGLMVVVREQPKPFNQENKTLLEALADYASISLVNVSLFKAVEDRARSLQSLAEASRVSGKLVSDVLKKSNQALETSFNLIFQEAGLLVRDQKYPLNENQLVSINTIQDQLRLSAQVIGGFSLLEVTSSPPKFVTVSFLDLSRQAANRCQKAARDQTVTLHSDLPTEPVFVLADVEKIEKVFEVLLLNAFQVSTKGKVVLKVHRDKYRNPQVSIMDSGPGFSKQELANIFEPLSEYEGTQMGYSGPLGIELPLVRAIIQAHGGQLWVESPLGKGSTFHFTLKPVN